MSNYKADRFAEDLRREISAIIPVLKDPRIGTMLSVVRCEVAGDKSFAKVYISSLDGIAAAKEAVRGLESAQGFIKRELNAKLRMRVCPELKFIADDSIEHSSYISDMLNKINKD
ncbi:MAG TPA: 30S ribosome-binding factor RbfA [Oscillospiraceae bacterium]|nr:30S ribosome-binding factor RbfA [Oscillospiraceae bacterium]